MSATTRINLLAERVARRVSGKLYSRVCADGPKDYFCGDLAEDIEASLLQAGSIACSEGDTQRLIKQLPKYQRDAVNELYRSLAKGATDSTMAKVRNRLIGDAADTITHKPGHRRNRIRQQLDALGVKSGVDGVVQTTIRTHGAIAYNAAVWVAHQRDPRVWGYEYITADDERVRPQHSDMEGMRYPKKHLWWRRYAPPNGFNCRCRLRPIFFRDSDARIRSFKGTPEVDPMFRFNPGMIFGV